MEQGSHSTKWRLRFFSCIGNGFGVKYYENRAYTIVWGEFVAVELRTIVYAHVLFTLRRNLQIMEESKENQKTSDRQNIDSVTSGQTGIAGAFESALRRFRNVVPIFVLALLYLLGSLCMGIALVPGIYWVKFVNAHIQSWHVFLHHVALGTALAMGYFMYGFTLIFVVPLVNFLLPLRLRPWRGIYYSLGTVPWYIHNALTYLVRYTFLLFITPTPFNVLFYRLMGMKIGRGVQINTVNISDPCLLKLEDKVTIGGSATIISHYASGGFLIIAPVRICRGATVGMKATIMGDVEIGEKAKVLPNSVVMPKTRIPEGEVWGGVPAQFIKKGEAN